MLAWLVSTQIVREPDEPIAPALVAVTAVMTILWLSAGPPAFYYAARIMRPHPINVSGERHARHCLAATATAYGFALLTWIAFPYLGAGVPVNAFGAGWLHILIASILGPTTLVWGLVSVTIRTAWRNKSAPLERAPSVTS